MVDSQLPILLNHIKDIKNIDTATDLIAQHNITSTTSPKSN
jgi:hypothetical protein